MVAEGCSSNFLSCSGAGTEAPSAGLPSCFESGPRIVPSVAWATVRIRFTSSSGI